MDVQLYKDCLRLVYHVATEVRGCVCESRLNSAVVPVSPLCPSPGHMLVFSPMVSPSCDGARKFSAVLRSFRLTDLSASFELSNLQHKSIDPQQVRQLVKQQFFLHAHETDANKIANLKRNAMSALTNYVMHISVGYVPRSSRL
jgi:hypothetical protein